MRTLKWLVALVAFGAMSGLLLPTLWAQVPILLTYQDYLRTPAGPPVTTPVTVQFSLYRGGTATEPISTGTLVYRETASLMPSANGFSHVIGTGTAASGQTLEAADFAPGVNLFLEIAVNGGVLLPRQRVVSLPTASQAGNGAVSPMKLGGNEFKMVNLW